MRSTSRRLRHLARDLKADPSVISAGRDPDDHDTFDLEDWLRGTDPWSEPMTWQSSPTHSA